MSASRTLKLQLLADTDKFASGLKSADRQTQGFGDKLKSFGKKAGVALAAIGVAAGAMAYKIGKDAIGAASDLNETLSKSNAVFGETGAAMERWADGAAEGFGQSKQQALDAASTFGNLFVQLGIGTGQAAHLSASMTELASDFASFHNADITEVISAQTAAFRGEYDAVQRFVPTINAAAVETAALEATGKKLTSELTAQEKALAVQKLMMEGAGDAAGDFDRTSDSLANQQKILTAKLDDTKAALGAKLLPVMQKVMGWVLDTLMPIMSRATAAFSEKFGPALATVTAWVRDKLLPMLQNLWTWIRDVLLPGFRNYLAPIIEGVRAVFEKVTSKIGENRESFSTLLGVIKPFVEFLITRVYPVVGTMVGGALKLLGEIIGNVIDGVGWLIRAIETLVGWFQKVKSGVDRVLGPLGRFVDMAGRAISAAGNVRGAVTGGVRAMIPGLAAGGIVTAPTLAVVGEGREPEAVLPLSKLDAMLGGGGGGVTINVTGTMLDPEGVARAVEQALHDARRRTGGRAA